MDYLPHMADITIGNSEGRGRGVFAARRFESGETIEVCPVIALSETDARALDGTGLYGYYFGWGQDGKSAAIALGSGSLYNHSPSPNATHHKHVADGIMSVVAARRIERGEEIFIRYDTGTGGDAQQMWFDVQ
jgi:SET domain-containing protein